MCKKNAQKGALQMLIEFSVANFKSIAERQTFSMLPAKGSSYLLETGNPHYPDVLRIGGVFGANGSGKSTLLEAFRFLQHAVETSGKHSSSDKFPIVPFRLDEALRNSPSSFEIIFNSDGEVWRYGVELDASLVHAEWLYRRSKKSGREKRIFHRDSQVFAISTGMAATRKVLESTTSPNQLLLSKLDQFSDAVTHPAYIWITLYLEIVTGSSGWFQSVTARKLHEHKQDDQVIELLRSIGMNFSSINVTEETVKENTPEEYAVANKGHLFGYRDGGVAHYLNIEFLRKDRTGQDQAIFLKEESLGTRALFGILGVLIDVLRTGMVIIIDELNQSFHPEFLRLIVELVRSPEANFGGAQLIFSAHDTSIMSILERDELWITEKQDDGSTQLYSLADMGPPSQGGPRRRGVFGKHYLENKYGGLPEIDLVRAVRAVKSLEEGGE